MPPDVRQALETDPRVHLLGPVEDPRPAYALMGVVALPTHREGLPNVALEAAAMGLPVVATPIPRCVDAVADGVTGTLVPVRAVAPLTAALRAYLDDPELRRRHGARGRERVLVEFEPERIWQELHREYDRLLDACATRRERRVLREADSRNTMASGWLFARLNAWMYWTPIAVFAIGPLAALRQRLGRRAPVSQSVPVTKNPRAPGP